MQRNSIPPPPPPPPTDNTGQVMQVMMMTILQEMMSNIDKENVNTPRHYTLVASSKSVRPLGNMSNAVVLYCTYMHPYEYTVSRTTVQLLHQM